MGAAVIGFILIISLPAGCVHKSAHGQKLDPAWGAPVDALANSRQKDEADGDASVQRKLVEFCRKEHNDSGICRKVLEDDRRPTEKHPEWQQYQRRQMR